MTPISEPTPTLSLVLPTYNERPNLPGAIARITQTLEAAECTFEIVVVDDNSPDETWRLAEELSADDHRIRVIRRMRERGLATAVVAGWRIARGRVCGVMDADLQYPPETLPVLLNALERSRADIAICSRYVPGATVQNWSAARWLVSWSAREVGRLLLPSILGGIADPGAGYFVVRRQAIEGVELNPLGFKILIEVLARGRHRSVIEVGLPYEGRKEGQSKFRMRQVVEYITHLARLSHETGEAARAARRVFVWLASAGLSIWLLTILTLYGLPYLASAVAAFEGLTLIEFVASRSRASDGVGVPSLVRWHLDRLPGAMMALLTLTLLMEAWDAAIVTGALLAIAVRAAANFLVMRRRRRQHFNRHATPITT